MLDDGSSALKLLVIEEQELYHALYPVIFNKKHGIELLDVIDRKPDGEIVSLLKDALPEVLLYSILRLDAAMIGQLGLIRREFPAVSIVITIIINDIAGTRLLRRALVGGQGGLALFLKQSVRRADELSAIIRSVAGGQIIIDPDLTGSVFCETSGTLLEGLTPREQEILSFIAGGYTNDAIADVLGIDMRTVRHHINSIYSKLKTDSCVQKKHPRVSAARFYMETTGELSGPLAAVRR
jgi:DNA-binding NarL/FixJ family response regulator